MSFENKGSMVASAVVTSGAPDRSGNFVIEAADVAVVIEAAWTYLAAFGGGTLVTKGAGETWTPATQINSQGGNVKWVSDWSLTLKTPDNFDTGGNNEFIAVTHDYVTLIDMHVDGNKANQSALGVHGIAYRICDHGRIVRPFIENCDNFGVFIRADAEYHEDHIVSDGVFIDNGWNAIEFNGGGAGSWLQYCHARNNFVSGSSDVGIAIRCNFSSAIGNHVIETTGTDGYNNAGWAIACEDGDNCVINDNVIWDARRGIQIQGFDDVVDGNTVWNISERGIITGVSTGLVVSNNRVHVDHADAAAIVLYATTDSTAEGNVTTGTAGYDGIWIRNTGGDNVIIGNVIVDADNCIHLQDNNDGNYIVANKCSGTTGINITAATNNGTRIGKNDLSGTTTPIVDSGTDTILPTISGEFPLSNVGGGATAVAPVINTSPGGIDIDDNDEFAHAKIPLPIDIQQVVRIKIWAYSNVIETTNNMLLRIVAHGAGSSELWSGNAIDVVNHPSEETGGIVQFDVIHWVIDAGDDAQIGTLAAQDLVELLAVGEPSNTDIATDALFGGYNIEYV